MSQHRLNAPPRHPHARVTGYLVKFTADANDEPVRPGVAAYSIIGKIIKDEFEARTFWAAHHEDAHAIWIGP